MILVPINILLALNLYINKSGVESLMKLLPGLSVHNLVF